MWNRLVAPPINVREGMEGEDEGTSSKEANGGREWLSMAAMTVDGGVSVGLQFFLIALSVKKTR